MKKTILQLKNINKYFNNKVFKFSISAILLSVVIKNISVVKTFEAILFFGNINLIIVSALVVTLVILMAYKWFIIINVKSSQISFRHILAVYWASEFAGIFGIGTIGSEVYKLFSFDNRKKTTLSIVVDRVFSLFWYLTLALSFFIMHVLFKLNIARSLIYGLVLYLIILIFFVSFVNSLFNIIEKKGSYVSKIVKYLPRNSVLIKHSLISTIYIVVLALIYSFTLVRISPDITINTIHILIFLPVLMIVLFLPITIQGIGIREFIFYEFAKYFNVSSESIIGMSTIVFSVALFVKFVGAIPFFQKLRSLQN